MKQTLQSIFRNYPYLCDETILSNLLNKVDNDSLEDIKSIEELSKFLFKLTKQVQKEDLLSIIYKLQANIDVMDYALKDHEEDLALSLKILNTQNIQFIEKIIDMLDILEFKEKKEI